MFSVVVAEACPRARCTVTTSQPEALALAMVAAVSVTVTVVRSRRTDAAVGRIRFTLVTAGVAFVPWAAYGGLLLP